MPPLIFGVAFGNLLQGVPFQFDDYLVSTYTGSFWQLLNPFALLAGVVSSAMITMHGGAYLAHRTEGVIQSRAVKGAVGAALVMVAGIRRRRLSGCKGIDGFRITSVVDPSALPDPLAQDGGARGRRLDGTTTQRNPCCGCCPLSACWARWPPLRCFWRGAR